MSFKNKDKIRALLKSIETGQTDAVAVVNEDKYVQHNPHTQEGSEGLAELFQRLSKTSPRVEIVRAFEDGNTAFSVQGNVDQANQRTRKSSPPSAAVLQVGSCTRRDTHCGKAKTKARSKKRSTGSAVKYSVRSGTTVPRIARFQ